MFGFLNVYKPKGKTSHDVVAILRRITKVKQIGHTGTLDPFAEGVLPICIGKATRLIEYLDDDKAYIGTIKLGESTTTYDIEGQTINISNKMVKKDEIETALKDFQGEIEQIPPIYSAIKVNGKKLYEYAREGKDVEIKPRKVTISELKLLDFDEEKRILKLYISCSKGTYIRSIANDLGEKLGTYGHLTMLVRVKAGMFDIETAKKLEDIDTKEKIQQNIKNPLEYLNYPKQELQDNQIQKIKNGMEINFPSDNCNIFIMTYKSEIAAVGSCKDGIFKPSKVFL